VPHKLDSFVLHGKAWTVDPRLHEFRHITYGEPPEFVPFESEQGKERARSSPNLS
jgi:hypothetical protein